MDWFERLTGFREGAYAEVQQRLQVEGTSLRSRVNGAAYAIGTLELVSLGTLRARTLTAQAQADGPRLSVQLASGNVADMHRDPVNAGALFQVASQFNLLEMVGPEVTPEAGVTRYAGDPTQGPACAMAAGAATLYRNYCVPVGAGVGQTRHRQLNALADLGAALASILSCRIEDLWTMRNGYALPSRRGLQAIHDGLLASDEGARDHLRSLLRIGVQTDVEVTGVAEFPGPRVSQAFCSAMPVAYTRLPDTLWQPLATLVLEAAYEATLHAAVQAMRGGGARRVLLTRLGGGVFGNDPRWIDQAIGRALHHLQAEPLEVVLVSRDAPGAAARAMADAWR